MKRSFHIFPEAFLMSLTGHLQTNKRKKKVVHIPKHAKEERWKIRATVLSSGP